MNNEEQIIRALREQESALKKCLNRQLAAEAMLEAFLRRVDPLALAGLAEEYEAAVDRVATALPPALQLPALWHHWSALIEDRRQSLAATATPQTRGAG